jgi:CHAT domain-containing protein
VLRRETAGRPPAPRTLALLADPVFQADDPRLVSAGGDRVAASADGGQTRGLLSPAGRDAGPGDLRRLRFSRREGEAIASLVPAEERFLAYDFDASRQALLTAGLADYRYLHLATHALVDDREPQRTSLVFSLVDAAGTPRNGYLRLHDVYALDLNAELVTLSACETALGREVRGEGLVGLARGFMFAGARRVVASLWSVQDRATAELMRRFYAAMLEDGLPPAAALRAAQVSMLGEPRWSDPYFWAPFVLQGEWR